MNQLTKQDRLRVLPLDVFEELYRSDELEWMKKLRDNFDLKKNQEEALMEVITDIFLKDLAWEDLPKILTDRLKISRESALALSAQIGRTRLSPLKDYFGEVERFIIVWGGAPETKKEAVKVVLPDVPKGRETKGAVPVIAPTAKAAPGAPKSQFEKRTVAEVEVEIAQKKKSSFASSYTKASDDKKATEDAASAAEDSLALKIKSIVSSSNLSFSDPTLRRRLETIISARLRDVRDETETKEMLLRGDKVGGLGLNAAQAEGVMKLLSEAFAEVNAIYKKTEEEKKSKFIREQLEKEELRKMEKERREREEREKLYARVTGVAPTIKSIKKPTASSQQQAANSKQPTAVGQELQATSYKLQAPAAKPRVEEVKFTPKIAGPIGELRQMNLAEFRRLSKDPRLAAQKIKDKLELLADEDYGKKIEGIKAWQESSINNTYLMLLKDSLLKGQAVGAAIEEAAKIGETLTKDEFTAIMELNRDLRF